MQENFVIISIEAFVLITETVKTALPRNRSNGFLDRAADQHPTEVGC
jgi:hypothetical protein